MSIAKAQAPLHGRRVLIVEDVYLIAASLCEHVQRLGGEVVGPCASIADGIAALSQPIDLALLDINVHGELVYELADRLRTQGVPFAFITGYSASAMPPHWSEVERLEKPIDGKSIAGLACALLKISA